MTEKLHCDVCNAVVGPNEVPGVVYVQTQRRLHFGPFYDRTTTKKNIEKDLCPEHYNQLRNLIEEWIKNEENLSQGQKRQEGSSR